MSANFTPEKEDLKILTPFKMQVLTNFPYIEADFDALTNYQLLCKIVEYLNTVIAETNEVTEQVLSLYDAYVALQDYVNQTYSDFTSDVTNRVDELESYMNNYFNNLDVQTEINNKLDAMVEDGSFTTIVGNYIDPIFEVYKGEVNLVLTNQNNKIVEIDNKISNAVNGNPLVATSTADMTDTSKIYVLTTDGNWYYYSTASNTWVSGGSYQSAVSSSDTELIIPLAYTDLDDMNEVITSCKVTNKSDTYVNYKIQLYAYSTNSVRIFGVAADTTETRLDSGLNREKTYNENSHLFMYDDANVTIQMILDWSQITANKIFYFKPMAYQTSYIFDVLKFPSDKHIKFENSGGASAYVEDQFAVRNAIKSLYLKPAGTYSIELFNGQNSVYAVRLKSGATNLHTEAFPQNFVGIVPLGSYGGIYIDSTVLTKNHYSAMPCINYNDYDNYMISNTIDNGNKVFYCGSGRALSTLKAGIEEATKYMNSILYVDSGTYDLITEFGSSYFENLTSSSTLSGLRLKNNIHIIFSANSKVTSNYTGTNEYAMSLYSPFNAGEYGFTLENLTLECSNCRYAIHDERNGATEEYQANYINCKMKIDNSQNTAWPNKCCIGGGLGSNATINIDNCIFETDDNTNRGGVYYHQSNNTSETNFKGNISIKNCYFITGAIQFDGTRTDSTADPHQYIVTNNDMIKYTGTNTEGIYVQNLQVGNVYAWNNHLRTN